MTDRKQEILDAALRGFAEKGLAGTTVEEVRTRSGASVGSIYHHFGDKQGIAAALYVAILRDYQEGLLAVLERAGDARDTVEELVRHHLRWVAADRDRARFLLGARPPRAVDEIRGLNRRAFSATASWLDEEVAAGRIRPIPFDLFYAVLIGPARSSAATGSRGACAPRCARPSASSPLPPGAPCQSQRPRRPPMADTYAETVADARAEPGAAELVLVERSGAHATVTLNDPGKLNPLGAALTVRLREALTELAADEQCGRSC